MCCFLPFIMRNPHANYIDGLLYIPAWRRPCFKNSREARSSLPFVSGLDFLGMTMSTHPSCVLNLTLPRMIHAPSSTGQKTRPLGGNQSNCKIRLFLEILDKFIFYFYFQSWLFLCIAGGQFWIHNIYCIRQGAWMEPLSQCKRNAFMEYYQH